MSRRLALIANPAASAFTGGALRDIVTALSDKYDVETLWPSSADDATVAARDAAEAGADAVAAMGGDGVVHRVVNGIVGTGAALVIIPSGTTNVLARLLGIPEKPKRAVRYLLRHAVESPLKLAHLTYSSNGEEHTRYATFAVGVGFDATVVAKAEQEPFRKYRFGAVHYARSALGVLWSDYRGRLPHVRVDDGTTTADASAVLIQIHWPFTFAGRLPVAIAPQAPRGVAAIAVERLALPRIPLLLSGAFSGGKISTRGTVTYGDVDRLWVVSEPDALLQADGELLGPIRELTIDAVDDALTVYR